MKPTARSWRVFEPQDATFEWDQRTETVWEIDNDDHSETYAYATSEANAALIVRAVNSHEAMVDVVRDLIYWADFQQTLTRENKKLALTYAIDKARAALKLTGGK